MIVVVNSNPCYNDYILQGFIVFLVTKHQYFAFPHLSFHVNSTGTSQCSIQRLFIMCMNKFFDYVKCSVCIVCHHQYVKDRWKVTIPYRNKISIGTMMLIVNLQMLYSIYLWFFKSCIDNFNTCTSRVQYHSTV